MDEKGEAGRPEFTPTEEHIAWVKRASEIGLSQEIISMGVINPDTDLPITVKTLRKHFRKELDYGLANWGYEIVSVASEVAKDKNDPNYARMAIWLMQSRLGMKATTVSEIVGKDGESVGFPQLVIIKDGNKDPEPADG